MSVGFDRSKIDFVQARALIEGLSDVPSAVRARALAAFVGMCSFADDDGVIAVPSMRIAEEFEISRVSWLQCRDVLERAGLVVREPRPGRLGVSDKGAQTWRCWSGGHRGTAIDAIMAHRKVGVRDAIVWLAENYGHLPVVDRPPRPAASASRRTRRTSPRLRPLRVEAALDTRRTTTPRMALRRGLNDDILHANLVGTDPGRRLLGRPRHFFPAGWPAVVYPALDQTGRPVFFQARYLNPPPGRGKYDSPSSTYAANPRLAWTATVNPPFDGVLVVCEGIAEALVAAEAGLRAVSVLGAHAPNHATLQDLAVAALASSWGPVICFDADATGRSGADRLRQGLCERNLSPVTLSPPVGHDITTWSAADSEWWSRLLEVAHLTTLRSHDRRRGAPVGPPVPADVGASAFPTHKHASLGRPSRIADMAALQEPSRKWQPHEVPSMIVNCCRSRQDMQPQTLPGMTDREVAAGRPQPFGSVCTILNDMHRILGIPGGEHRTR